MKKIQIITNSSNETMEISKKIAKYLQKGDTVILTGELGCGKTKFVEGFLNYYNLQDEISSPTFNIVNEYTSKTCKIYHFDVYRLADVEEFYAIGGEEYFEKGICLIEWGELIEEALPDKILKIKFKKDKKQENVRYLEFEANGERYEKILEEII